MKGSILSNTVIVNVVLWLSNELGIVIMGTVHAGFLSGGICVSPGYMCEARRDENVNMRAIRKIFALKLEHFANKLSEVEQ